MRGEPDLVRRIARKAAAQMVVNAALAHPVERHSDGVGQVPVAGAPGGPPDEIEQAGLGKLRRALQAAVVTVDDAQDLARGGVHQTDRQTAIGQGFRGRAFRRFGQPAEGAADGLGVLGHRVRAALPDLVKLAQQGRETGAAIARLRRKIGAAPVGLHVGSEEHGERPAALFPHQLQRLLVDRIDVGPFLAVDLDADEALVHHVRGGLVLETLVGHDVAPVTGRIADAQQDRPVFGLGPGQRRLAPRQPMNRIVFVLQQVRACFFGEFVCHQRFDVLQNRTSAAGAPTVGRRQPGRFPLVSPNTVPPVRSETHEDNYRY